MLQRLKSDRETFQAWWAEAGLVKRLLAALVLSLLAAATLFAFAVMGPRLHREGALLWFGERVAGVILDTNIRQVGAFKDGAPKYELTLTYGFEAPDGRRLSGTTVRTDVRDPPDLSPGAPIGVYFDRARPENSVAEHNLRTDVYALALFLPFLAIFGIALPVWFAAALLTRRKKNASADP